MYKYNTCIPSLSDRHTVISDLQLNDNKCGQAGSACCSRLSKDKDTLKVISKVHQSKVCASFISTYHAEKNV